MSSKNDKENIFLSIGELAKVSGVRQSTLKYYTEIGILPFTQEGERLLRKYKKDEALQRLSEIQKLKEKRLMEQGGLSSSGEVKDIHELDKEHLIHAYETAMSVAEILNWNVVHCVENGRLKSIEEIHKEIYDYTISIFRSK